MLINIENEHRLFHVPFHTHKNDKLNTMRFTISKTQTFEVSIQELDRYFQHSQKPISNMSLSVLVLTIYIQRKPHNKNSLSMLRYQLHDRMLTLKIGLSHTLCHMFCLVATPTSKEIILRVSLYNTTNLMLTELAQSEWHWWCMSLFVTRMGGIRKIFYN